LEYSLDPQEAHGRRNNALPRLPFPIAKSSGVMNACKVDVGALQQQLANFIDTG
jgi:hypothetical protein